MGQRTDRVHPFSADEQLRLLAVALRVKLAREGLPVDSAQLRPSARRLPSRLALAASSSREERRRTKGAAPRPRAEVRV